MSSMDTIDFEIYDIRNLAVLTKPTVVDLNINGVVNDIEINYDTTLVAPDHINTYNELSDHILTHVLEPLIDDCYQEVEELPATP